MSYPDTSVSVLIRVSSRDDLWRVAIILPDRILWRSYRRADYSTPEAVIERCLQGLSKQQGQDTVTHAAVPAGIRVQWWSWLQGMAGWGKAGRK